jgi:N-acetylglucosaminyldiphosphoundecaprenol N-acetyl-beta-D-mannosaminyltransferase
MFDSVYVLGTRLDRVTLQEAANHIERLAREEHFSLVVTANPEIIMQARRDATLQAVLQEAALSVADGIGVVWAASVLGGPVPERVPGIDLMAAVLERAARHRLRVYLLGTRPGTIERAAENIARQYPGVDVCGCHHGYFSPQEAPGVVRAIGEASPELLFVGMGVPREQKFLHRWRHELGPVTAMGVGGSFDVLSGEQQRAPLWMQRMGGEWLYRLVSQPGRLPRQATRLPAFVLAVLAARLHGESAR